MIDLINQFNTFSFETFIESTCHSCILKLKEETEELENELQWCFQKEGNEYNTAVEAADAILCITTACFKAGISPELIQEAMERKIEINKTRKWIKNADNTYSHI